MKKYLFCFVIAVVFIFSGCDKKEEKQTVKTQVEEGAKVLGRTNDNFKRINWAIYENTKKSSFFEEVEMIDFNEGENSIVDVYAKGENSYIAIENSDGGISYSLLKDGKVKPVDSLDEALDGEVLSKLNEDEEFWGFERQGEYLAIIKNSGTDIYDKDRKLFELDGVAAISDLDNNGTFEVVMRNSEGNEVTVSEITEDKLYEVWKYKLDSETFHGDIQIGDLNNDGVKEIYLNNINEGMEKLILSKEGFLKDPKLSLKQYSQEDGAYFILDINSDGKTDVIIQGERKKPLMLIQK